MALSEYLFSDSPRELAGPTAKSTPSLKARWVRIWIARNRGLFNALRRNPDYRHYTDSGLAIEFLTGWEGDLSTAIFLWDLGDRPSREYYAEWGVESYAPNAAN